MKYLLFFTFIVAYSTNVVGQNQTIGFFDSDYILEQIPEYGGIEQQLDLLSRQWREEIRRLESEIQELEEDYEAKEILYTEDIRNQKQQEIVQKKQEKESYTAQKFGPEGEYFTRQRSLLEPIQRQLFAAVRIVAEQQDIDFVFDRSRDINLVYANNQYNLNEEILEQLGIEIDEQ